jgi:hypothetical protein
MQKQKEKINIFFGVYYSELSPNRDLSLIICLIYHIQVFSYLDIWSLKEVKLSCILWILPLFEWKILILYLWYKYKPIIYKLNEFKAEIWRRIWDEFIIVFNFYR